MHERDARAYMRASGLKGVEEKHERGRSRLHERAGPFELPEGVRADLERPRRHPVLLQGKSRGSVDKGVFVLISEQGLPGPGNTPVHA
jgi:hypothetical protein